MESLTSLYEINREAKIGIQSYLLQRSLKKRVNCRRKDNTEKTNKNPERKVTT